MNQYLNNLFTNYQIIYTTEYNNLAIGYLRIETTEQLENQKTDFLNNQ